MKINKKTIASAALLLMLAMPAAQNTYGQGGGADGFLFSNTESGDRGDGATWGEGENNRFTADNSAQAPVGSGLLVLAASGACYAALKVRRSAKGQKEQGNGQTEI